MTFEDTQDVDKIVSKMIQKVCSNFEWKFVLTPFSDCRGSRTVCCLEVNQERYEKEVFI